MSSAEEIDAAAGSSVQLDSTEAVVIKVEEQLRETAEVIFEADFQFYKMETKIHRFPPGLRGLGDQYVVPMVLAIGPYHRDLPRLQEMAMVKHVATHYFIHDASREATYEEIYDEFFPVAAKARSSYARGAVAGIQEAEFVDMMFHDACFLLQYMQCMLSSVESSEEKFDVDPSLRRFFFSNRACIDNDVMLLENQLPWTVLEVLSKFSSVKIEDFVALMGNRFQITEDIIPKSFVLDPDIDMNTLPHLLGFLRLYKLGRKGPENKKSEAAHGHVLKQSSVLLRLYKLGGKGPENKKSEAAHGHVLKQISVSSAIELAEIGVRLKPSKTENFMDMGMEKGAFLGKLFLAPLSLDSTNACWLVNMAAFEVCTVSRFKEDVQKTAVCSYIALLAMLMDREEDVHRLQSQQLLHGNHTNMEMLKFFKSVDKHLPDGGYKFACIMAEIEAYKLKRWIPIKLYKFGYRYWKTVAAVLSILGAFAGIVKAVLSI